jgi:hypothetical protein
MTKSSARRVARKQQRQQTSKIIKEMDAVEPARELLQEAGETMKAAEGRVMLLLRAEDAIRGGNFRGPDSPALRELDPERDFGGVDTAMADELAFVTQELNSLIPHARLEFAEAIIAYTEAMESFQGVQAREKSSLIVPADLDAVVASEITKAGLRAGGAQ